MKRPPFSPVAVFCEYDDLFGKCDDLFVGRDDLSDECGKVLFCARCAPVVALPCGTAPLFPAAIAVTDQLITNGIKPSLCGSYLFFSLHGAATGFTIVYFI